MKVYAEQQIADSDIIVNETKYLEHIKESLFIKAMREYYKKHSNDLHYSLRLIDTGYCRSAAIKLEITDYKELYLKQLQINKEARSLHT